MPAALVLALGTLPGWADPGGWGHSAAPSATDLDTLLALRNAEEVTLSAELNEARAQMSLAHQRIVARGRWYVHLAHAGLLPASGGFDAFIDHLVRIDRTRRAIVRDLAAEAALAKKIGDAEQRRTHLLAERASLEAQRDEQRVTRAALQQDAERRAAFARAFEASTRPESVTVYGTDYAVTADRSVGFRSLKGRLPFPVAGRAEVTDVRRASGPGLELQVPPGSIVRSVAPGRVAFADRYDDYGLTLILDHGDHYFSLYANMGTVDVALGEAVGQAARLGSVGSNAGARLYFELRHHAATIDPRPWLGL
jgi:murein DD-endopeptidase MepM/ murein hydrolase activator NlpD